MQHWTQHSDSTTGSPLGYLVCIIRTIGESPSTETDEVKTQTGPVASVGKIVNSAVGLKK